MVRAKGSRSHPHTGWWVAGALLLALGASLAWTARQDEAWRARAAALERENQSLRQALAARAGAAAPSSAPAGGPVVASGALAAPTAPRVADPFAAVAKAPPSSPRRQGPFEEALQAQREAASRARASPFGRP